MTKRARRISVYLDSEAARRLKRAARAAGTSQSGWIANLVREKLSREWPASVRRLAGAWPDLVTAETLRSTLGDDAPREPL
jgi:hypothetical protein